MTERLTDDELHAVARSFTEQSIEAAAVNEAIALRAELVGAREVLSEYDKVVDGLRARVAELENAAVVAAEALPNRIFMGGEPWTPR